MSLFEIGMVGLPVAFAGVLFVVLFGPRCVNSFPLSFLPISLA